MVFFQDGQSVQISASPPSALALPGGLFPVIVEGAAPPRLEGCGKLYLSACAPYRFGLTNLVNNAFVDSAKKLYSLPKTQMQLIKDGEKQPVQSMDLHLLPKKAFVQAYTTFSEQRLVGDQLRIPGALRGGPPSTVQNGFTGALSLSDFTFTIQKIDDQTVALRTKDGHYAHLLPAEMSPNSAHGGTPGNNTVLTVGENMDSVEYFTAQWELDEVDGGAYTLYNVGAETCLQLLPSPTAAVNCAEGTLYPDAADAQYKTVHFANVYGHPVYRAGGGVERDRASDVPACLFSVETT